MDESHRAPDGNHFGGVVPDAEVKDSPGIGQDVSEVARRLDDGLAALVAEPDLARGHVHLGQVALQSDELDLGAVADPDPGPVRHDQFRPSLVSGIEGPLGGERRIPDHRHPVPGFRNVAEQIALDVIDPAHHHRGPAAPGDSGWAGARAVPAKSRHAARIINFFVVCKVVIVRSP